MRWNMRESNAIIALHNIDAALKHRRYDGDGEVCEKPLQIRYFQRLTYRDAGELAPAWQTEPLGKKKR
jgi:hypothetical protein